MILNIPVNQLTYVIIFFSRAMKKFAFCISAQFLILSLYAQTDSTDTTGQTVEYPKNQVNSFSFIPLPAIAYTPARLIFL